MVIPSGSKCRWRYMVEILMKLWYNMRKGQRQAHAKWLSCLHEQPFCVYLLSEANLGKPKAFRGLCLEFSVYGIILHTINTTEL
jgi:hypothetical protein